MHRLRHTRRKVIKAIAGISAGVGAAAVLPMVATTSAAPIALADSASPLYKDPTLAIDQRVSDLLSRMTLEEKATQLITLWSTKSDIMAPGSMEFSSIRATAAYPASFGHVARPSDRRGAPPDPDRRARSTDETIRFINAVQHWAVNETRLGIPVLFHEEALHGFMAPGATMFPQAIAMAGTFDPELVRQVHVVIAREMRAHGSQLALTPVVDIVRDPRWGRIEETFGEDPHLCAEMGVAAVLGLQGQGRTLNRDQVFATLKHMTGHGQPQSGTNAAPATLPERELRESFFPPFREVVARTGISAVMPSYNEIDGIPAHNSKWLISDVLRGEWRFDGIVVSDYHAVEQAWTLHEVAGDLPDAALKAIAAGVDSETPEGKAYRRLPDLVHSGRLSEQIVDAACRRMLSLKFRAGLFENPFADVRAALEITGNADARALALRVAQRSICLLKNDGTLPLTAGSHRRVAVIGPNAGIARLGGYSSIPQQTISLFDGVRTKLAGRAEVLFHQGVFITRSEDRGADDVQLADPAKNRELIRDAVAVAENADVIILTIGDTEQTSREGYAKNHLGDRADLDLLGEQNALFDALHALGKPMVIAAINGRPPSYPHLVNKCAALLECWYPGQEGGTAIADAIFGDINPGAKLPVTVARSVDQIPIYYNARPVPRPSGKNAAPTPLFPFGFGLSYTTFSLSPPRLSSQRIAIGDSVTVDIDVRNIGTRSGDEVVQVYLRQQVASTVRPIKQLRGFERISLQPGEQRTVHIVLPAKAFSLWNSDMNEVIEPGLFDIMTGSNSLDLQTITLEIA